LFIAIVFQPKPIRLSTKTGLPLGVFEKKGLTARALANLDAANREVDDDVASVAISVISTLSLRPKGETPEERLVRKHALKEYRKVS
jgi:protein LTV1